jgi:transposase
MTTLLPANVKVHLALGYIDCARVSMVSPCWCKPFCIRTPFTGHLFVFRGRTGANLIKIIYWDGTGFYLFIHGSSTASSCGRRASRPVRRCH